MGPKTSWDVLKDGRVVLSIKNEPGPIVSTAGLPPGARPAKHPFLTAAARDPMEEDSLRSILEASGDFESFVSNLRRAGYTVAPASGS